MPDGTVPPESEDFDRKSLRLLDSNKGYASLAQACVCFANASGGQIAQRHHGKR